MLEFQYRVVGAEPTTHKVRPVQEITPRLVKTSIAEDGRPIRWRVVAYDTDLPDFVDRGGDIFPLTQPPRRRLPSRRSAGTTRSERPVKGEFPRPA